MPVQPVARLGTLLQEFGVLSPEACTKTEELSAHSGLPFGKCLILLDLITDNDLKAVLEAQSLLRDGIFEKSALSKAVQKVCKGHVPLSDALQSMGLQAKTTRRTRLGELLADAQAISPQQLDIALKAADFSALPLGHILTTFDALEPALVDYALDVQSQIRKGSLARAAGIEQIRQANLQLSIKISAGSGHFALGEILIYSKILTSKQIEDAIAAARERKQLIGEYLVENELISDETLTAALCVQNLIGAHLLSIEAACDVIYSVAKLKEPKQNFDGLTFQDFLKASGYLTNSKLRVVMAKLSSDPNQTLDAFKHSLEDTSTLRELLSECFPDEVSLVNAGAVLYQLFHLQKLSLNQALLTFAFRKNGVSIATAA
ncbi:MAG: hypothetical protein JST01_24580 [Cyanobacteria bacterium SZAS TMP-1]|nr:hypothetical protein [Cyanobacteria bacterium SZAS TMP-1]